MATNVYHLEERIYFSKAPCIYYGWYLSTSSSDLKIAHFNTAELRTQMEEEVSRIPNIQGRPDVLAALALINASEPSEEADVLIASELGIAEQESWYDLEVYKAVEEIGERYLALSSKS